MEVSPHTTTDRDKKNHFSRIDLKLYPSAVFTPAQRRYCVIKRILDVFFATLLLILCLPVFAVVALAIVVTSRGPVFFRQERMGRYGKTILVFKFRSMSCNAPNVATCKLHNPDQYITSVGRFLRVTSLDELPQLINILRGDMSFVGPRPLILAERGIHIGRMQKGVYCLRPGLTGLAQVSGRDLVTVTQKVKLDEEYLHRFCMKLDWQIIFRTIGAVAKQDGVSEGDTAAKEQSDEMKDMESSDKDDGDITRLAE